MTLIDFGADYDYFTSDITRTWAVSGKFTPATMSPKWDAGLRERCQRALGRQWKYW